MTLCRDGLHAVLVANYLFGQHRIQIIDTAQPDPTAPEEPGPIVRQLCTYRHEIMEARVAELVESLDPLALAESWAKPWNCEYPGGRIRLDNEGAGR